MRDLLLPGQTTHRTPSSDSPWSVSSQDCRYVEREFGWDDASCVMMEDRDLIRVGQEDKLSHPLPVTEPLHLWRRAEIVTDSVTGPSLRTIGPIRKFVVLSDSPLHTSSGAKSAGPEVDSLVRTKIRVHRIRPFLVLRALLRSKDDRTLVFTGDRVVVFDAGSILAEKGCRSAAQGKSMFLIGMDGDPRSKEIEDLKSQLLKAKEESAELKVTDLESTSAEKDHALSPSGHLYFLEVLEPKVFVLSFRNSTWEALGHAFGFGRAIIERDCRRAIAAGLSNWQRCRCLTDLEAYIPLCDDDFNSVIRNISLMKPPAEVPSTNVLSTVVIIPRAGPSVSVEDYDNPDSSDVVSENATLGTEPACSLGDVEAVNGDWPTIYESTSAGQVSL
ncbi:hypothetical protein Tco_0422757 [Tanacetum coccineum]